MATRVLIYTHAFAPQIGGVETVVMSLAKGLAGLGQANGIGSAEVTVATSTLRGDFDDASLPFRVVRRPSLLELLRLIRAADVIHLAGPSFIPMLLGLFLRKSVVVEHHGFQTICPNGQLLYEPTQTPCPGHFMAGRHSECIRCNAQLGLLGSLKLWLLTFPRRWLCKRAQSNITPTKWLGRLLRLPRSTTIYHGLPENGSRDFSRSSSGNTTFAFLGRLVGTKGARTLLEAAQQLSAQGFHYRLKVIGDGPDRESLQQQAVALGLADSVQFLGYVAPERLEEELAEAATVVMPSIAGEVFGMVAAENMSRGKLVIVSDVGAMREVVGDAGLSFAPGDARALAQCMKRILEDATLPVHLGLEARRRASEQFGQEKMVLQHLQVYQEAVRCND
ncbi:MAG: hypothetical protein DMG22_20950 [Acidobacteria bacterium]|nr:MAG: hypothetical protein DMG22_20950 [Acidobacteriota bacterium]